MPVQDIRSNLIAQFMGSLTVAADTTTTAAGIIDTALFELGLMFSVQVTAIGTPAGTATLIIEASDDPTFATGVTTFTPADDEYIGTGILTQVVTLVPTALLENRMVTAGIIASARYVRVAVLDAGGDGATVVSVFATQKAEDMPTEPAQ